jgi:Rha family phage regulatory protein
MTDLLKVNGNQEVITSREIAELTGKQHAHVMRDIRSLISQLTDLEFNQSNFGLVDYRAGNNQLRTQYALTKEGSLLLMTGYNVNMRLAVQKRWQELEESQNKLQIPTSFKEALLLAVKQQEQIEEQELKLAENKPKVEYHDEVLDTSSTLTITSIAKELGMSAIELNSGLHRAGIQYKQGSVWHLYSKYANWGLTKLRTHKISESETHHTTTWTEKGREFIHCVVKGLSVEHLKPTVNERPLNLLYRLSSYNKAIC